MGLLPLVFVAVAACGLGIIVVTLRRSRHVVPDFAEYFEGLDFADDRSKLLAKPVVSRVIGGAVQGLVERLARLLPTSYMAGIDHQLAQAGLIGRRTATQQLSRQLAMAVIGALAVPLIPAGTPISGPVAWLLFPALGFMTPPARLKGAIKKRHEAILKDLPDIVDMLAIAVEAGSGFEAALALVCQNFSSPLADEFSMTLHEMELGLSRKAALQQMRDRLDIDVVRTLILALLQAEALGIAVGRVLKSQATEVRARRRAWAREKAAKLPVKIMGPLVLFIFPPILGLVLGPAAMSFGKLGGG